MKNFVRNFKYSYAIFNIFNKKKLKHNISLYKEYGLNKNYFSPVSSKDFKNLVDRPRKINLQLIKNTDFYKEMSEENQSSIDNFEINGYSIVKNFLSDKDVDKVNEIVQDLLHKNEIKFSYINKLMFVIKQSKFIHDIGNSGKLLEFLSLLFDGKAKLFQSINFLSGSQQKTHSDSVHMTTYPLGGLLGVWIALEDITSDNGPLHYYPGSHTLPYFLNSDYDNEGTRWMLGKKGYLEYERMLQEKIINLGLKKEIFYAKKGDMLIWHANILHGGEPHIDNTKTRKSMVFHYFDEKSICYHEVTQRPALF